MGCCAVHRLREAVLVKSDHKVKISETYQMLGEIDEELRRALRLDVVGVHPPCDMFGVRQENWKPFILPVDGTEVLVPGDFNYTKDTNGDLLIYPQGDILWSPFIYCVADGPQRGPHNKEVSHAAFRGNRGLSYYAHS